MASDPSRPTSMADKETGASPETGSLHNEEEVPLDRIATADYPRKMKLVFITFALAISIFLVALDMTIVATVSRKPRGF